MPYVTVPKDLTKVKSKVLAGLTKRQLLCFGSGALIGVPLFFLLKKSLSVSAASLVMMLVMVPAFLLAVYEPGGQPLEDMPIGMQFTGAMFSEAKILRLAQVWENDHNGIGIPVNKE